MNVSETEELLLDMDSLDHGWNIIEGSEWAVNQVLVSDGHHVINTTKAVSSMAVYMYSVNWRLVPYFGILESLITEYG